MSLHSSTEEFVNRNSSRNIQRECPEIQTLKQEAVNEQIRGVFAPLTHQLGELTQLVQGISTSRHPNSYPRTGFGTTSGTAMPQSNMLTGAQRIGHRRRSKTNPDTDDETTYPDGDRQFRPTKKPEMTNS